MLETQKPKRKKKRNQTLKLKNQSVLQEIDSRQEPGLTAGSAQLLMKTNQVDYLCSKAEQTSLLIE